MKKVFVSWKKLDVTTFIRNLNSKYSGPFRYSRHMDDVK